MTRIPRLYLVILTVVLLAAGVGLYMRHRAAKAAADCATPAAPPPPSAAPPPALPGFAVEVACGTGSGAPNPAPQKTSPKK